MSKASGDVVRQKVSFGLNYDFTRVTFELKRDLRIHSDQIKCTDANEIILQELGIIKELFVKEMQSFAPVFQNI